MLLLVVLDWFGVAGFVVLSLVLLRLCLCDYTLWAGGFELSFVVGFYWCLVGVLVMVVCLWFTFVYFCYALRLVLC